MRNKLFDFWRSNFFGVVHFTIIVSCNDILWKMVFETVQWYLYNICVDVKTLSYSYFLVWFDEINTFGCSKSSSTSKTTYIRKNLLLWNNFNFWLTDGFIVEIPINWWIGNKYIFMFNIKDGKRSLNNGLAALVWIHGGGFSTGSSLPRTSRQDGWIPG